MRSIMVCYHPRASRRVYHVEDSACQVCLRCVAVRTADFDRLWDPVVRYLRDDGIMLNDAEEELGFDWRLVLSR